MSITEISLHLQIIINCYISFIYTYLTCLLLRWYELDPRRVLAPYLEFFCRRGYVSTSALRWTNGPTSRGHTRSVVAYALPWSPSSWLLLFSGQSYWNTSMNFNTSMNGYNFFRDQHHEVMRWFLKRTGTTESVLLPSLDQLPGTVCQFKFKEQTL